MDSVVVTGLLLSPPEFGHKLRFREASDHRLCPTPVQTIESRIVRLIYRN